MMYQIRKLLGNLEHYELVQLKQQLKKGDFEKELGQKIREEERKHCKWCATCSNELDLRNTNNYTLLFGPEDFKKRASFCGMDCLQYFINNIKTLREGKNENQIS